MKKPVKKMARNASGFTLIEMSIVIMIVGVLLAGMTPLYSQYIERRQSVKTQENLKEISDAIGAFRAHWGRYPCAASMAATRDDPQYGREQCATLAMTEGTCTAGGGVCVQGSVRPALSFSDPAQPNNPNATVTQKPRVQLGFIPFRQLGLEESQAYDSYGNRIVYAVTENLAYSNSFQPTGGGINISSTSGNNLLAQPGTAHFFVASPGKNSAGAYSKGGQQNSCDISPFEMANTNCNMQPGQTASFIASSANTSGGNRNFDDISMFYTQDEIPLWQAAADNPLNIHQKAAGAVGINVASASHMTGGLYAAGAIRVQDDPATSLSGSSASLDQSYEGRISTNHLCQDNRSDCFETRKISGFLDQGGGMRCPPGQYMQGIKAGEPVCSTEVVVKCPAGQVMKGVNQDGSLICDGYTETRCPATVVDACGTSQSLPQGTAGQNASVSAPSTSYAASYQCNVPTWTFVSTSGNCTICNADQETRNTCPSGFDGERIERRTKQCPSGNWGAWQVINDSCVCNPRTEDRTLGCTHAGETGSILERRTSICPDQTWGSWQVVQNTCSCTPETENRSTSCPAGQTGIINQSRNKACPSGSWSNWADTTNTCTPVSHCTPVNGVDAEVLIGSGGRFGGWTSQNDAEVRYRIGAQHKTNNTYAISVQLEVTQPDHQNFTIVSTSGSYWFEIGGLKGQLESDGNGISFYDHNGNLIQRSNWSRVEWSSNSYDGSIGNRIYYLDDVSVPYSQINFTSDTIKANHIIIAAYTAPQGNWAGSGSAQNVSVSGASGSWGCPQSTSTITSCDISAEAELVNSDSGLTIMRPTATVVVYPSATPNHLDVTVHFDSLTYEQPGNATLNALQMYINMPGIQGVSFGANGQGGISRTFTPPVTYGASSQEASQGTATLTIPWNGASITSLDISGMFYGLSYASSGSYERIEMSGSFNNSKTCGP